MIKRVYDTPDFHWIDIIDPPKKELAKIAEEYHLHPASLKDCLDPEHLPKFEKIGDVKFVIIRSYDEKCSEESDEIQELTRKIAIFIGKGFIISVHRKDQKFLDELRSRWASPELKGTLDDVISDLLLSALRTYEVPLDSAFLQMEKLENQVFNAENAQRVVAESYFLKRKASIFKRLLRLSSESIQKLGNTAENQSPLYQDLRESAENFFFYADDLLESVNSMLNLHVQMESQKTNEVMRLLTIFSVFFLPLNFIAGVYGMNFEHMPELAHPYAYPAVLAIMLGVSLSIYAWIRAKGWLK